MYFTDGSFQQFNKKNKINKFYKKIFIIYCTFSICLLQRKRI